MPRSETRAGAGGVAHGLRAEVGRAGALIVNRREGGGGGLRWRARVLLLARALLRRGLRGVHGLGLHPRAGERREALVELAVDLVLVGKAAQGNVGREIGVDSAVELGRDGAQMVGHQAVGTGRVVLLLLIHLFFHDDLLGYLEALAGALLVDIGSHACRLHPRLNTPVGSARGGYVCSLLVLLMRPLRLGVPHGRVSPERTYESKRGRGPRG